MQLSIIIITAYTAQQHAYPVQEVYLVGTSCALCAHSFQMDDTRLALPGRCVYYSLRVYSHDNALGEYTLMNATYAIELSLLRYDAVFQRGLPSEYGRT